MFYLPGGSLTQTRHSSERCRQVAQDNLVLVSEAGSNLHGIAVGGDDRDLMGVCVDPPEAMLGFDRFQMYEYRSQPTGCRSGSGDLDLNVYGLAKWSRLIATGNPTTLLPLFTPTSMLEFVTWAGEQLRQARHLFIAKSHGGRFLGYLNRQRRHLTGELQPRCNRPELIEKYGYDTKYASHCVRIALQGIELMQTGEITLPMTAENRALLCGMRTGAMREAEALTLIDRLNGELRAAIEGSPLQPSPRYDAINDLLIGIYREWWERSEQPVLRSMFNG